MAQAGERVLGACLRTRLRAQGLGHAHLALLGDSTPLQSSQTPEEKSVSPFFKQVFCVGQC